MKNPIFRSLKAAPKRQPPAGSKRRAPRSLFFPLLLFGSGSAAVVLLAAWSAVGNPALASIVNLSALPTPTYVRSFAQAWIAKPTFTATAQLWPSPTSTEALEEEPTPGTILAEIVADTPTSEYIPAADGDLTGSFEPALALSYGGGKYILVDIADQYLYAYENDALIYSFVASTGMNNATRVGIFSVLDKIPSAYGSTWDLWMANWLGIYWAGGLENGIHALPILSNGVTLWSGFLGRPISYGCVVLGTYEARVLYDWAEIGTTVEIQW